MGRRSPLQDLYASVDDEPLCSAKRREKGAKAVSMARSHLITDEPPGLRYTDAGIDFHTKAGVFLVDYPWDPCVFTETAGGPLYVDAWLTVSEGHSNREQIGRLAHDLFVRCSEPPARRDLVEWLKTKAGKWVQERRPALAAVIEAAAQLAIHEAAPVIVAVLEDDEANLDVASVAAQRVRLLNVGNPELRARIGDLLIQRIEQWRDRDDTRRTALLALPSASHFLWKTRRDWIERMIAAEDDLAWATCQGLLDVAAQKRPIDGVAADSLYVVSFARLDQLLARPADPTDEGPDLAATLAWLLGALATEKNAQRTADMVKRVFDEPRGLTAAAGVRAGRLLVNRCANTGTLALLAAFGVAPDSSCTRYFTLLVNGR